MGVYMSSPITDKHSDSGGDSSSFTQYGVTSMQGWRCTMEDAHVAIPSINNSLISMYGVFDGHGGSSVSTWVSHNIKDIFQNILKKYDSYSSEEIHKNSPSPHLSTEFIKYAKVLESTFLELDIQMQKEENLEKLKEIQEKNKDQEDKYQSILPYIHNTQLFYNDDNGIQYYTNPENNSEVQNNSKFPQEIPTENIQKIENEKVDAQTENSSELNSTNFYNKHLSTNFNNFLIEEPKPAIHDQPYDVEILKNDNLSSKNDNLSSKNDNLSPEDDNLSSKNDNKSLFENHSNLLSEKKNNNVPTNKPIKSLNNNFILKAARDNFLAKSLQLDLSDEDMPDDGHNENPESNCINYEEKEIHDICGATAIVALIIQNPHPSLIIANAGDSRAVLSRNGKAIPLSFDHKPMLPVEFERIKNAGGSVVGGRVDGNLNLSRSLGDLSYKKDMHLEAQYQRITAFPDITIVNLTKGDEFIVIACDGIWDCKSNQDVIDFVIENSPPNPSPTQLSAICESLCDQCLSASPDINEGLGCDNMTCVIIKINNNYFTSDIENDSIIFYNHSPENNEIINELT